MILLRTILGKRISRAFLGAFAFIVLLTPTCAFSAERDDTVLFFSFDGFDGYTRPGTRLLWGY
jgi:hypothetical protein